MKHAPYGKLLAARQEHGNPPLYAVVAVGMDAWSRAKVWNESNADTVAMVLPAATAPDSVQWPVDGIPVVIDADAGPSMEQVTELARVLVMDSHSLQATLISFTQSHPYRIFRIREKARAA